MTRLALSIIFGVVAFGSPASAQEPEPRQPWVLSQPDAETVAAVAAFPSGLSLLARCQDGAYDLIIAGLPPAGRDAYTREIGLRVGEAAEVETVWTVGNDLSTAFSRLPAPVARQLARGGDFQIVVSGGPGRPRVRYLLALEAPSPALEQTLTACGRPLVDPRDAEIEGAGRLGPPPSMEWASLPRAGFPRVLAARGLREGYVVLSCLVARGGRPTDCQVESENPAGGGLAEQTIRGLSSARLRLKADAAPGETLEGRVIAFTTRFQIE